MNRTKRKLKLRRVFIALCLLILVTVGVYGLVFDKIYTKSKILEVNVETPKSLKIGMTGDVLIHSVVYKDAQVGNNKYDFKPKVSNVKPLAEEVDLAFYNQESIIGGKALGLSTYPMFNSPEEIGDAMVDSGFNLVSLANNHTLDRGEAAIKNSLLYWSKKPVVTAGSYTSKVERDKPRIYVKNGIKYGFLAYTTLTNGFNRPEGKEYLVNVYDKEEVKKDISNLRLRTELLIVSMHWGTEYTHEPTPEEKEIAEYLSSLGVDLIIGHHPHVLQPIVKINKTWVVYSLGNFLSSQIGEAKLIGAFVTFDVVKTGNRVNITKPFVNLTYNYYNSSRKNIKIYRFDQLDNNLLPDYKNIYNKYAKIVSGSNEEVKVKPI